MTDEQILDIAESVTRQNKRAYSFEMTQEQFLSVARALLAAGASEGQDPVAEIIKCHNMRGDTWFDLKMFRRDIPSGAKLYLHPSAEIAALRERIAGMEKEAREIERQALERAAERCMSILGYPPSEYYANAIRALIEGASSDKEGS